MENTSNTSATTAPEAFNSDKVALDILKTSVVGGTASVIQSLDNFLNSNQTISERSLLNLMDSITDQRGDFSTSYGGNVNIAQVKVHLAEKIRKRRKI